jgi:plastocyanin
MRRLLFLLIPLALLVAACGDDDTSSTAADSGGGMDHMDGHGGNSDVADDARTITVTATSFEFDPSTIGVEAGEAVEIELTAHDVEHDFVIDELDAHVAAEAGETASGGFVAHEAGTYTYYCSVAGHRDAGMEGELVVK